MAANSRLEYLLEQYFNRTSTEAERQELLLLIDNGMHDEEVRAFMDASAGRLSADHRLGAGASERILRSVMGEAELPVRRSYDGGSDRRKSWVSEEEAGRVGAVRWRVRMGWAAAILLPVVTGSAFFLMIKRHVPAVVPRAAVAQYKGDVAPGHTGAVLHLSGGGTVVLDSVQNGEIAKQGAMQVVKEDGALKYVGDKTSGIEKEAAVMFNTITTNRGRQWKLELPDGSRVWLNAASSIRYPLRFTGKERAVEITGEAYFEVVHDEKLPFRVYIEPGAGGSGGMVEDIGTAFNINAYYDEPGTGMKTTLVEGAARVNGALLRPGQQAMVVRQQVKVSEGNVQQALAWKNGFFGFDHADIHTVMQELARWYDVDVKYEGNPDNTPFQGKIGRQLTLAQVLKGLEQVNVHFRIEEDKRIVILP